MLKFIGNAAAVLAVLAAASLVSATPSSAASLCGRKPAAKPNCSWVCVGVPYNLPPKMQHFTWRQICAYGPDNPRHRH
jgi:hypothetical protein